ncbi:hypothetical protein [Xenorhabdus siamensis]
MPNLKWKTNTVNIDVDMRWLNEDRTVLQKGTCAGFVLWLNQRHSD